LVLSALLLLLLLLIVVGGVFLLIAIVNSYNAVINPSTEGTTVADTSIVLLVSPDKIASR